MKDYKNIYQTGSLKANSLLKDATDATTKAKASNIELEEISALLALRKAEDIKFKNFESRYDDLMSNEKMQTILDGREVASARDVYRTDSIEISDGINMSFKELEAIMALDLLKKKDIDFSFVREIVK